ncbi:MULTISPECIES: hypothetical protein [unclassified Oceanobacter]|uniref:hypothetical protein n=1 Tax=unclassified Oceanobacter TaxID=2620260 RepID=UPI002736B5CF|nr:MULTISPECIES: hypothetical protein [unclassified Oceanobacter]MDP2610046.1 hypothetical protein [Oceanobacter sp. 1_MG-2023]MDP2613318.1 hypothetical protein [Oceanobacter sp. 2_MG-2023]
MIKQFEHLLIQILRAANLLQIAFWIILAFKLSKSQPIELQTIIIITTTIASMIVAGFVALAMQTLDSIKQQEETATAMHKNIRSLNNTAMRIEKRLIEKQSS